MALAEAHARLGGGRSRARGKRSDKRPQASLERPIARRDLRVVGDEDAQFLDGLLHDSGVALARMGADNFWGKQA